MRRSGKAFEFFSSRGRIAALGLALLAAGGLAASAAWAALAMIGAALLAFGGRSIAPAHSRGHATTRPGTRDGFLAVLDQRAATGRADSRTAVALVEIDDFNTLEERYDHGTIADYLRHCADNLAQPLGPGDVTAHLDGSRFAVALTGPNAASLEHGLQIATRLQQALAAPFTSENGTIQSTVSVGFALPNRVETPDARTLLHAATCALIEARRNAPAAIRSFSDGMRKRIASRSRLCRDLESGLGSGQIQSYFQPQFDLASGHLAGFETLTRWHHPKLGLVSPAEFLPVLRENGRMDELGQLMVSNALDALRHWDGLGHEVPQVGVNFSTDELRSPHLVDRIAMTLDARDIAPRRLVIEVLETVVAQCADDQVARNLAGLSRLGCGIDLDDFGTGYASITNIRKLSINRIKIDRSFIARVDEDPEQQDMIAAILTMADRLNLQTMAEGVETPGEQSMLTRLGCEFAQGFLFARPMPRDEADDWLAHLAVSRDRKVELPRRLA